MRDRDPVMVDAAAGLVFLLGLPLSGRVLHVMRDELAHYGAGLAGASAVAGLAAFAALGTIPWWLCALCAGAIVLGGVIGALGVGVLAATGATGAVLALPLGMLLAARAATERRPLVSVTVAAAFGWAAASGLLVAFPLR